MPAKPLQRAMRLARAGMETRSTGVSDAFGASGGSGWLGGPNAEGVDWRSRAGNLQANSTICLALGAVLNKVRQTRLYAGKVSADGTVTPTPLYDAALDFFRHGNPDLDERLSLSFVIASGKLFGTGYWVVRRDNAGRAISLMPFAGHKVAPKSDREAFDGPKNDGTRLVTRYEITPIGGGKPFEARVEDVIAVRLGVPDMDNPGRSIAPVQRMLRQVATDNEATAFLASVLSNMGFPGVILSPKTGGDGGDPSPAQRGRLANLWRQFKGEGAGDVFASPMPIDVSTVHMTPADIQVVPSKKLVLTELCAGIGVDPMAVGLPSETKTYANMEEAKEALVENTVLPDCATAAGALEAFLRREGLWRTVPSDVHVLVDKSVFRELDEDANSAQKRAGDAFRNGAYTRGEYRGLLGAKGDLNDSRTYQDLIAGMKAGTAAEDAASDKAEGNARTRSSRRIERERLALLRSRTSSDDGQT